MDYYDAATLQLLANGIEPIVFPGLHTSVTAEESKLINLDPTPKVILSASGMCEAGRIRHHLKHNLWRPESTILFVGYQSEGTLGRKLLNGANSVKLFGESIQVNARSEQMDGISGHADQAIMLDWLGAMTKKPAKVFVNHGENQVTDAFAQTIRERLGLDAEAPYNGSAYELGEQVTCLAPGFRTQLEKKKPYPAKINPIFERLYQAGRRLLHIIEKNRGLANRELAKFADQVTDLCNRWDR
jgi:metallo-beta-lactamase family protein